MNHFKLDSHQLSLLWRDNNWNNFLNKNEITDDFSKEECGICLEEIKKNGYIQFKNIYQCLDCGNFSHTKCINKVNEDHCLFCYKSSNPSLPI